MAFRGGFLSISYGKRGAIDRTVHHMNSKWKDMQRKIKKFKDTYNNKTTHRHSVVNLLPSTTATLSLTTVLKSSPPPQQPLICHQFKLFGVQRYVWAYKESVMYAFQTKMWA
ncbi:hypothetical protein L1987_22521 [Smallanthus sonchifolius]|uniref:Uncharacterized protein n=1 Tax=Smallanthus sonchifolius TaxID=185202 RepID=A0ACB9IGJ5_9ASTR|nr:hypothetical protein L1987_22521 [Smallanthus sonchifolius]